VTSAVANGKDADEPVMLLVLNGPTNVEWEEMQEMVCDDCCSHACDVMTNCWGHRRKKS
jgi:hypothetical protein